MKTRIRKLSHKAAAAFFALQVMFAASAEVFASEGEESLPLPGVDTAFKTYMDYRAITDKESVQYDLQQLAYTDSQGIRRIDGDVCVALGTGYADKCGERFEITLDSGNSFTAIVGDIKSDATPIPPTAMWS